MIGICHQQRNVIGRKIISIDRPGLARFTADKAFQRIAILTKLQCLYFRTVIQSLAVNESYVLLPFITSNQYANAEIADILPAKYSHDSFKDYTLTIGAGAAKYKHCFHLGNTPVNENTSKKFLQYLLHISVRQNFIQEHLPKKYMLFRFVVIRHACSLHPTAIEGMCAPGIHVKHAVIEYHDSVIRFQCFPRYNALAYFQYPFHT